MGERVIIANGYQFTVNAETGTTTATGTVQSAPAKRDARLQAEAGGTLRAATDQGGHLVGAKANGPAIPENLSAQDRRLNQGPYKTVENAEQRLLAENASIETEKTAFISGQRSPTGSKPDAYMVNDRITYADGQIQEVHLSFTNLTAAEQEELNQSLSIYEDMTDVPNPGDELRADLSTPEYSELMETTESSLNSIRGEFDEQIFVSISAEAEAEYDYNSFGCVEAETAEVSGEDADVSDTAAGVGGTDDGAGASADD